MIEKVWAVYYSATGNTKKAVHAIAEKLTEKLCVPLEKFDFTKPQVREREKCFTNQDLVVFGMPVYAGRLPNKILPFLETALLGNGAKAILVVTYGNRSYDDALLELKNVLEQRGFCAVAAAALVGQHAFAMQLATGRPDACDIEQCEQFACKIADGVAKREQWQSVTVPGHTPIGPYYTPLGLDGQPARFLKATPKTDLEKCSHCGLCSTVCPMGSIVPEDPTRVEGICIKCQACIIKCPDKAKYFDDAAFLSHLSMLEKHYTAHKENEFFYGMPMGEQKK